MLEVYVGGNENPVKFQRFQSSECVTEPTKVESAGVGEKDEKKVHLFPSVMEGNIFIEVTFASPLS